MPTFLSIITTILPILSFPFQFTFASPTPATHQTQHRKRSFFTLHQVSKGQYLHNGPGEVVKAFAKHGKAPVPADVLAAAHVRAAAIAQYEGPVNGSVPSVPANEYDSWYLAPVTVGNDVVQLNIDTGSADLWVYSSLQAQSTLKDHDYYHVESGRELENHTWAILYADGSYAEGKVYADKVVVGGVTATSQAVEAATAVSSDFVDDVQTDGLLGLAFNTLNTVQPTPQKTFFDNVLPDLLEPVFAVNLKFHAAGSYDFGYIDEAKYTGEITYVDVDNARGFWIITAGGYSVGQKSQVITEVDLLTDTGTSLTYLPTEIVTAYYAEVPGAQYLRTEGGWIFPCSAALPEFSLIISGVKQTMPGKYANFGPVDIGSPTCFGGIQDGRSMPNILGDTFLKSKYVIHEFKDGKARLGFAQQVGVQTVMGHD